MRIFYPCGIFLSVKMHFCRWVLFIDKRCIQYVKELAVWLCMIIFWCGDLHVNCSSRDRNCNLHGGRKTGFLKLYHFLGSIQCYVNIFLCSFLFTEYLIIPSLIFNRPFHCVDRPRMKYIDDIKLVATICQAPVLYAPLVYDSHCI